MRILYHHRTKSRDGQAVHIHELIGALRARGHAVREWALSADERESMGSEGGAWSRLLARLPRIAYEVAEHAYGPLVAARLAQAGRTSGAEVLYERHALGNTAGVRAARRLGVPLLLEVNSPLAEERSQHETLVLRRWAAASERAVLSSADRLLVVTAVLAERLAALGVERARLVVVPNAADPSLYPLDEPPEREEVVVGFTGFFRPWHGLEALVDGLANGALPRTVRLLLVGEGPSRAALLARAERLGVAARVVVTGAVDRAQIPALVSSMDVCVQPASTAWASPLKLFEYMAAARAIVAPDQPNLREVLTHGSDALLFEPGSPGAMAEAIARLAADRSLRRALGRQVRATLEERGYTWAANAARVEQIAQGALEERTR